jgi:glutamate racemase
MSTIGVFDSGFGGLTVLRALLPQLPGARFLYVGDTARLPYGAKSQATIARYAVESARFLEDQGSEHLVIACNTATALALDDIRAAVRIPVTGVIEPVVAMSSQTFPSADTLILATAATVESHAYRDHCLRAGLHPTEKACPLLVPLIEEGWIDHAVTRDVLRIYLSEALAQCSPRLVILGCTHYPLIAPLVKETLHSLGCEATVVDSAEVTAQSVAEQVRAIDDQVPRDFSPGSHSLQKEEGALAPATTFTCYATDSVEKFRRLGSHFLGQPIPQVELLDLGG